MTMIPSWFECVENHRESIVRELIEELAARTALIKANPELLADIACIALNTLKPRYIHRPNALSKYMTQQERESSRLEAQGAVQSAFEFVLLSSGTEDTLKSSTRDL
jgi:Late competence development protein ComFB